MNSYVYKNINSPTAIIQKATELYDLDIIEDDDCKWLGNDKMLIDVEENITRIIIYDISVNIKKLRQFIMRK